MNCIFYIFMEEYKKELVCCIHLYSDTLEDFELKTKYLTSYKINRNEDGKIHSRYLGDRYEPAIIHNIMGFENHYYLFDGDIKDCEHPFSIEYIFNENGEKEIINVSYYSSKRIMNGEPISLSNYVAYYNIGQRDIKILDEYESYKSDAINTFDDFSLLCDEMHYSFMFKFVD